MRLDKDSWKIIELVIRRYPDTKEKYEEYVSDIMSRSTSEETHIFLPGQEENRPQSVTEAKALKMNSAYMDRLKKEIHAVEQVYNGLKEQEKKVVRERYWTDRDRNVPYLQIKQCGYSERQMKRIVFKIIYQVGKYLGEIK